ncbi:cyclin-L1-1 isoform X2 [Amborella trichopoda]|uniref:Cyclin-L1-1 n=1 Tax=Amborella trichopoda TaxID=13333 RepID=U5D334_AMBTC|nr:cyclin-L1-1 isoform X2 [Amborella trichopoda]ERN16839.1 hypothetical protein AMTR_s00057p00125880 [Amborella trichopoda]|eukprot:XP_006855372.1 cyclin-L1-1 isoform X2 [Amborella trichopoda]
MIYTAIDTFYVTEEQLRNSPSRKDGIDEQTETTLRIYGCDLIQESGILLRLPQAVMATGQVLFHRFYCKKSFGRFNVKRVAASCVWLASKLEESPRKAKHVFNVFQRMECRRENLPIEHLDPFSKKYAELKMDLNKTERHLLKEMGFICHVEHPHKFILSYLKALDIADHQELKQEAWNLGNDSLRTTLCVRFKSEVVACGVVYAAARRFQVPFPENPPWWKVFNAEKPEIDEVCRVLAHIYSLPKAKYISVCKDSESFVVTNKPSDSQTPVAKESLLNGAPNTHDSNGAAQSGPTNAEIGGGKEVLRKLALDKLKESKKGEDDTEGVTVDNEGKEEMGGVKTKADHRADLHVERSKEKEREKSKARDRDRDRVRGRSRDLERDRGRDKDTERDREKHKDRSHRSKEKGKDSGHSEKSRHHSSRDRSDYHSSSYFSSREKDRHRHHPYG